MMVETCEAGGAEKKKSSKYVLRRENSFKTLRLLCNRFAQEAKFVDKLLEVSNRVTTCMLRCGLWVEHRPRDRDFAACFIVGKLVALEAKPITCRHPSRGGVGMLNIKIEEARTK